MDFAHIRMLIHKILNKDPYIVREESPLIILDIRSAVCMDNNGKDSKHTRHIFRRVNFVRNCKNCKMHNIDWCEGDIQFSDIVTNNVGDNDLNPRMKYITVRLDNWYRTLVQEGWHNTW